MIKFENISKQYKTTKVLKNINFTIDKGEIVVLIGESGCGKTTLLKMINALITPTKGNIYIDGKDIKKVNKIELRRKIGYVIQQTGLFPHLTISKNISLIPKLEKKYSDDEIKDKTLNLMEMVGLDKEFLNRYPSELSGGQQQRIGVARAFANDPDIILMDEPFSALDPLTRSDLQDEIIRLQKEFKKTIVFVTHDMDEAIKIADRICIMKDGNIIQSDTPENILKNPVNEFVQNFVGKNRIWTSPEFIKISDIMVDNLSLISEDRTVISTLNKMRRDNISSQLVINKHSKKLVGLISSKRLRLTENKMQAIKDLVRKDIKSVNEDDNILKALSIYREDNQKTIPVVNNKDEVVGLITRSTLVTALSQQYFLDNEYMDGLGDDD